jgi:hypothetical protein
MKKITGAFHAQKQCVRGLVMGVLIGSVLFTGVPAFAELVQEKIEVFTGWSVYVNGAAVGTEDEQGNPAEVFNSNGTVYLPVRSVSESLGIPVTYDAEKKQVYVNPVSGNYSDEMKIPYGTDIEEYGADSVERDGDHKDSPYFNRVDFYNAKSSDTLTILERFKTQQQTSEWSCGVSSALMVLNRYGKLGSHDEDSLSAFRGERLGSDGAEGGKTPGATNLRQMIDIFEGIGGFDVYSTFDCADNVDEVFTSEYIQKTLGAGNPIMVGWNDWGGHWQVIIGYDTMGTADYSGDDVIIVADPYDTTDHNQDGYGVYGAERFLYNFTFYDFFPEDELNYMCFLVAAPQK